MTAPSTPAGPQTVSTVVGATLCAVGLFLAVLALTRLDALQPLEALWLSLGLALFISGIGLLSYAASLVNKPPLVWGVPVTFGSVAALIVLAVWASDNGSAALLAVTAGAIGGVFHEIAQSSGQIVLPRTQTDKSNSNPELYLGTLSGLFLGAVAGILILSATQQSGLPLGLTGFTAGLALKGVSEAASTAATH